MKNPASSYTIWLITTVWRRKTSLLAILIVTLLLLVCVQYNITKEIVEISLSRQDSQGASGGQSLQQQSDAAGSLGENANGDGGGISTKNRARNVQFVGDDVSSAVRDNLVDVVGRNNQADGGAQLDADFIRKQSIDLSAARRGAKMPYVPNHRIVHLDLKGAPPKIGYLEAFFALVKSLGATGVLLEWEDMFPWKDNLHNLAAKNAYSREGAKQIITAARKNGLEIIPLIQTFGHLEFALKNQDFEHLREVPESPQALCPSLNSSFEFIQDMVEQIMQIHRDINYLHIGCDEVFHLGECSRCRKKARDDLFLAHVSQVARYIRKRHPYVTPIIWDDMLRHLPSTTLEFYNIGKLVEPMVWVYAEDVYRFVPTTVWEKYQAVFPFAWTASAFKGAFGETFYIPNIKRHLDNNLNWLSLMNIEEPRFQKGFRGIAITGWQRYDHFATLCEMLPASIPSLAVNLVATSHGYANNSLKEILFKGLKCGITSGMSSESGGRSSYLKDSDSPSGSFLNLDNDPFLWDQFSRCMFSGSQFYRLLYRWHVLEKEINEFLTTTKSKKGWLTDYNVNRNFTSVLRIDELMMDESRIYHNLISLVQSVNDALRDVYDKYTIAEWIEQKMYPSVVQMERLQKVTQRLKTIKIWPRRPLPPLKDLQRIGVTALGNSSSSN